MRNGSCAVKYVAIVGLAVCAISARANALNLGDFETGTDGWEFSTDAPDLSCTPVEVVNVSGLGNMLNIHWDKSGDTLPGTYLSISKWWDPSEQSSAADNLRIYFYADQDGQPWNSYYVARFASEDSAVDHQVNAYWPGQHTYINFSPEMFGVDQATFATMDYLEIKLTTDALSHGVENLPHASLYVDNIELGSVYTSAPTSGDPVPEPSSLMAFAMLGIGGYASVLMKRK